MTTRYYFAYGADMWKDQMDARCPGNTLVGKGTLLNRKWTINFRGYANIVQSTSTEVVHGLVYLITQVDEDSLDAYLAYPEMSSKQVEIIQVDGGQLSALLYFDSKRTAEGRASNEYIGRMSNAIEDALKAGVPDSYIKNTIRPFIPKLSFGYGSNLWKNQMFFRCPQCSFTGVGILKNWKWIINQRTFANVVQSRGDIVYGLLFAVSETDEVKLTASEGRAYTKRMERITVDGGNSYVAALVYIDQRNINNGISKPEYTGRINNGITDALKDGVPEGYVKKYLRPFIPVLYFAYGAHMSSAEMPGMTPKLWSWSKVGCLPGWKWNINEDGYANIVSSGKDVVYGLIYEVDHKDEARLDELAHPHYAKHMVQIETSNIDTFYGPRYARNYVNALVYVEKRAGTGTASNDYIAVMNKAIGKGIREGLPKKYVDMCLRPHIPAPQNDAQVLDDGGN